MLLLSQYKSAPNNWPHRRDKIAQVITITVMSLDVYNLIYSHGIFSDTTLLTLFLDKNKVLLWYKVLRIANVENDYFKRDGTETYELINTEQITQSSLQNRGIKKV